MEEKVEHPIKPTCYICGDEVKGKASKEHVIPNSIGGRLKSYKLLCDIHNIEFGSSIDKEIDGQLGPFADIVVKNKDRKTGAEIILMKPSGEVRKVDSKLIPFDRVTIPTNDGSKYIYEKPGRGNYLANRKKKELEMNSGKKYEIFTYQLPPPTKTEFIVNSLTNQFGGAGFAGFGGKDYHRAIAKIAVNYYLYKEHDLKWCARAIDFIKGDIDDSTIVQYYVPDEVHNLIHQLNEGEVSHVLHIKGSKKERLLYVYVELLNFQRMIVTLSLEYDGEDVDEVYCYDLINGEEIKKIISIRLHRHHMEFLGINYDERAKKRANKLFNRLENIINGQQK